MSFKSTNQYKLYLNTMNGVQCCFMLHSKLQNKSQHTKHIIKVAKTTGTVSKLYNRFDQTLNDYIIILSMEKQSAQRIKESKLTGLVSQSNYSRKQCRCSST